MALALLSPIANRREMMRLFILSTIFCASLLADTLYYQVHCASGSNGENKALWIIGDSSSVTITPSNQVLVRGASVSLRKETQPVSGCTSKYGWECHWVPCGLGEECKTCGPLDKGWNVFVLRQTGSTTLLYCGVGTTVESFTDKKQWLNRVFDSLYDLSNSQGITKSECLVDQSPTIQ